MCANTQSGLATQFKLLAAKGSSTYTLIGPVLLLLLVVSSSVPANGGSVPPRPGRRIINENGC